LSDTITNSTYDVTSVAGALSSINVTADNSTTLLNVLNNPRGITLFAPNNSALAAANCIGGLLPNNTALVALFGNHVCFLILHFTWFDFDIGYQWYDRLLTIIYERKQLYFGLWGTLRLQIQLLWSVRVERRLQLGAHHAIRRFDVQWSCTCH
jgi:hypothetical protein